MSPERPGDRPAPADERAVLVHCGELERYDFGPGHPMAPGRVRAALELADELGVLERFRVVEPPAAEVAQVRAVHTESYLAALHREQPSAEHGLGAEDNPAVPGLAAVAERIAAATTHAARLVWEGKTRRALNIAGGLHHAMADRAAGFCLVNDAAVAIAWLLDQGARRVAYLDLDAHHGDGVERAFWDDPRVLTISVHESGLHLFPGTGFAADIGGRGAEGTAVNVALPPTAGDLEWLRAIHGVAGPLLQVFKPELIVSQHGADPHLSDHLTHLEISVDAMAVAQRSVAGWADAYAGGRWVALGGGGYNASSCARVWAELAAAVAGVELDPSLPLPEGWARRWRVDPATRLGDPHAAERLDRFAHDRLLQDEHDPAMVATSRTVFPWWGLTPYH